MSEFDHPDMDPSKDPDPIKKIRTKEPQAPFGSDEPNPTVISDATAEEQGLLDDPDPGVAGYEGRDAESEMPRVPAALETQEDSQPHGGEPKTDKAPPASN